MNGNFSETHYNRSGCTMTYRNSIRFQIFLFLFKVFWLRAEEDDGYLKVFPESIQKLSQMESAVEMISFYGYPAENYTVQTKDGYLIPLERIPNPNKPPILLVHGLQISSNSWVMSGPWSDLSYYLHDKGYDVWLVTTRGTRFSNQHVKYNSEKNPEYWNFSWHEIGLNDLPASIDFILKKTDYQQLSYVGFSQGCTAFFVMTSLLPEYNKKIKIMHALAPAVYLKEHKMMQRIEEILTMFEKPYLQGFSFDIADVCMGSEDMFNFCLEKLEETAHQSPTCYNRTMLPVVFNNFLVGASLLQTIHYYQVYKTHKFAPLEIESLDKNETQQKPYPLERVTTPIAIYYVIHDDLISEENIEQLIGELPNVIEKYKIPNEKWTHFDIPTAMDARTILYPQLLEIQQKFEKQST